MGIKEYSKRLIKAILPHDILRILRFPRKCEAEIICLGKIRPHYYYCVYQAARLAKKLGYNSISVIEFGVAGGNGLLSLEKHSMVISKLFDIDIEVYGFDTGKGLPMPSDYRDLPYQWKEGLFPMNIDALREKLSFAKLIIGNVKDTVKLFFEDYNPSPIGAIMWDMDLYSSTVEAMNILNFGDDILLPRVFNYFDDIIGSDMACFNDYTGELLAIKEYNTAHKNSKFCPAYHLIHKGGIQETWFYQIFILHSYNHSKYNDFVREPDNPQYLKLK